MVGGGGEVRAGAAEGEVGVGQGAGAGWRCLATGAGGWTAADSDLAAGFAVAARVFSLQMAYGGGGAGARALLVWSQKNRAERWSRLGRYGRWGRLRRHGWWSWHERLSRHEQRSGWVLLEMRYCHPIPFQ